MDGILIIDKPVGPTSHDVVSSVRKILKEKKVGHTGTLDPAATGVLPLVLGKATKLARYVTGGNKRYLATLKLGVSTDTLDAEGTVTAEKPVDVTEEQVRAAVAKFVGAIDQVPPMYSAKKIEGQRLYELARQGVTVEREAKRVTIFSCDVLEVKLPEVTIDVLCSAGTYVRVLAADIGDALGCGAHLNMLRRTAAGSFTIDDAVSLEALADDPSLARTRLLPLSRALADLPSIALPVGVVKMVTNGYQLCVANLRALDTPNFAEGASVALVSDGGDLVAVAEALVASSELSSSRRDRRALKTERVLAGP